MSKPRWPLRTNLKDYSLKEKRNCFWSSKMACVRRFRIIKIIPRHQNVFRDSGEHRLLKNYIRKSVSNSNRATFEYRSSKFVLLRKSFSFFLTQILIFLHGHKKILVQFDNFKIVNKSSTTLTLRRFYFTLVVHSSLKTTFLTAWHF